ncbi:SAV_915 family protein [Streptomyces sp. URMC 123]|uniref:SAV_915 family protein n=1 Tax=Streptomyces sp. URMC 123 TaxID=3423403 RepID=UPI003F1D4F24
MPVRVGPAGTRALRLFRTSLGERTAVAFTSEQGLIGTMGRGQPSIRLAEPALRALTAPLGVTTVTVDPQLTARPTGHDPAPRTAHGQEPAAAHDRPRPTGHDRARPTAPGQEPAAPHDRPRPTARDREPRWDPDAVGVLRVTGAAAALSALMALLG